MTPEPKILTRRDFVRDAVFGENSNKTARLQEFSKPAPRRPSPGTRKQISVPMLKSEKINNPRYINYHELIRNKIKKRAYFYVDDPDFRAGEVYLTFVLSADGVLRGVKIIDANTRANDFLRAVGLRSIKEASPFPAFPKELQYPELTFNVIISFELED